MFLGPALATAFGDMGGKHVKVMVWAGNKMIFFKEDELHKSWLIPTQVYRRNGRKFFLLIWVLPRPEYEKYVRPKMTFFSTEGVLRDTQRESTESKL